jgi:hypothetical protein
LQNTKPFSKLKHFSNVPAFIHTIFQDQQVATNPFDRQQDSKQSSNNNHPAKLGSSLLFPFIYCQLVNGFGDKVHPHQHVMPSAQEFCLTLSNPHHVMPSPPEFLFDNAHPHQVMASPQDLLIWQGPSSHDANSTRVYCLKRSTLII